MQVDLTAADVQVLARSISRHQSHTFATILPVRVNITRECAMQSRLKAPIEPLKGHRSGTLQWVSKSTWIRAHGSGNIKLRKASMIIGRAPITASHNTMEIILMPCRMDKLLDSNATQVARAW
jgi:hypothetical protein